MIHFLAKYYSLDEKVHLAPLDFAVVAPNYFLYLFGHANSGYVVVESQRLSEKMSVVRDIEVNFPVEVVGWCALKAQRQGRKDFLGDKSDQDSKLTIYDGGVTKYAVLRVKLHG